MADPADSGKATISVSMFVVSALAISRPRNWHERTVFDETRSNAGECPVLVSLLERGRHDLRRKTQELEIDVSLPDRRHKSDGQQVGAGIRRFRARTHTQARWQVSRTQRQRQNA